MSHSLNYFGKELDDLTYQDVIDYFTVPRSESTTIEYKSYGVHGNHDDKLRGIYKALTAFLNSSGGIVIWGSPQGQIPAGQTEEIFQGPLSPITQAMEQDRTINLVTDNISPAPSSIRLKILEDNGNYICVFEVEQSSYRPHQYNNIYYSRLDGQSRPAPHYLVEALFKQIRFPNIEGYLKINSFQAIPGGGGYLLNVDFVLFNFSELENEKNISLRVLNNKGNFRSSNSPELRFPNLKEVFYFGEPIAESDTIVLTNRAFDNDDYTLDLTMYFGGEKSPLKISEYTLDLSNLAAADLNDLIVNKEENITFKEKQMDLGVNREALLRDFLGR